ncbi:MAG: hypothetical protein ACPG4N_03885 [Gammaproteobacteria bacterium]
MIKAVFAFIFSVPLVGFITGMVVCQDCGTNVVNRAIVGGVMAIFTTINLGMPPVDKGSDEVYNLWPYIFLSTVSLLLIYAAVRYILDKKTSLH